MGERVINLWVRLVYHVCDAEFARRWAGVVLSLWFTLGSSIFHSGFYFFFEGILMGAGDISARD